MVSRTAGRVSQAPVPYVGRLPGANVAPTDRGRGTGGDALIVVSVPCAVVTVPRLPTGLSDRLAPRGRDGPGLLCRLGDLDEPILVAVPAA
jgi:hypothetical protein